MSSISKSNFLRPKSLFLNGSKKMTQQDEVFTIKTLFDGSIDA